MEGSELAAYLVFGVVLLLIFGITVLGPLAFIAAAFAWTSRRVGIPFGSLVAVLLVAGFVLTPLPRIGIGALYFAIPPLRSSLVSIDFALSRSAREETIRLAVSGALRESDRYGGLVLPDEARGLSVYGTIDVLESACGQGAFFMTLTGFSPDPYAGFEYMPLGCEPETDPLGSGQGTAESLGEGWYWIEAS